MNKSERVFLYDVYKESLGLAILVWIRENERKVGQWRWLL